MTQQNSRTDLAIECIDMAQEQMPEGIRHQVQTNGEMEISIIDVNSEQGSKSVGKPIGKYITIQTKGLEQASPHFERDVKIVSDMLNQIIPKQIESALVVGLGNSDITPDALGPQVVRHTLATRHIDKQLAQQIGLSGIRPVSVLAPGVLGQTGIETAEIIKAVCNHIHPDVVIAVDALASKSIARLGKTIQIANTGISPGSGVLNRRQELSMASLGVPVISMGVPTVVDLYSIAQDVQGIDGRLIMQQKYGENMMVTPRSIDQLIEHAAKIIAYSIGKTLQPSLSVEELMALTA